MKKEDPQEMRKQEAAKYVGCSVRSLENYTKQGRIGERYSNLSRAELLAAIEAEELKATKGGGEWKIRREALEEYIRKNF